MSKKNTGKKIHNIQKLSWRLNEASSATGLSVPFLRKKIRTGDLRTVNAGSCVLIMDEDLKDFLKKDEK